MKAYDIRNGKDQLLGYWKVTRKIDGVQVIFNNDDPPVSRRGKPLYGIPKMPAGKYEVFINNWEDTVSHVRSRNSKPCPKKCLFSLSPIDDRLYIGTYANPPQKLLTELFEQELTAGHEGLVIFGLDNKEFKIKRIDGFDVKITGIIPGKGRLIGMVGALMTPMGNVGSGLTDTDRKLNWEIGETIEVESMGLTPSGKFRHPRFIRRRIDK